MSASRDRQASIPSGRVPLWPRLTLLLLPLFAAAGPWLSPSPGSELAPTAFRVSIILLAIPTLKTLREHWPSLPATHRLFVMTGALFGAWAGLTLLWTPTPSTGIRQLAGYASGYLGALVILAASMKAKRSWHLLLLGFGLATVMIALVIQWEISTGQHLLTANQEFFRGNSVAATFIGTNNLAAFLLISFSAGVSLATHASPPWIRIAGIGSSALSAWGAFQTDSRAVLLAIPAILLAVLLLSARTNAAASLGILLGVAIAVSAKWRTLADFISIRAEQADRGATESDERRTELVSYAFDVLWRTGGMGSGSGSITAFQATDPLYPLREPTPIHNTLPQVAAEYGFIGFILLGLLALSPLISSTGKHADPSVQDLRPTVFILAVLSLLITAWLGFVLADLTWWMCLASALALSASITSPRNRHTAPTRLRNRRV